MKQLNQTHYSRVVPVIEQSETRGHVALVYAVIEGTQPGKVFADDEANPQTALVCPASEFNYVFGAVSPSFVDFLPELLAKHLRGEKELLFPTSVAWRRTLDPLFPEQISRLIFDFRPAPDLSFRDWERRIPAGFELKQIDEELAGKFGNRRLDPWIIDIWGGPASFAAKSWGLCLVKGGQVASFCAAIATGHGEVEVEVGTAPEYRRQGLASIVCAAFIEQCLSNGLRPSWSTDKENVASIQLAKKLGFVLVEEVAAYPLPQPIEEGVE